MKFPHKICFVFLCLLPYATQALRVQDLFTVEVPIADQSEALRSKGVHSAFRLLLIKLTGDRQAAARASLSPLLIEAQRFVQQYSYREIVLEYEIDTGEIIESMETRLSVKFDQDNLNQALRGLSQPLWGNERPSTLVWLTVDDATGRSLVGLEEGPEYMEAIARRAQQRGIPLLYPLLDLDDNAALRASDVWASFRQPVIDASARYFADAILTGAIEFSAPGIWEARWTVYIGDQMATWTSESDLLEAVLDEGIDNLADILASQFIDLAPTSVVTQVNLSVADVFSIDHYADVLKYLSSLNSVVDVEVEQLSPGQVTFTLSVHGGQSAVSQAIELGRVLEAISSHSGKYRRLP